MTAHENFIKSTLPKCEIDHWLIENGWTFYSKGCYHCTGGYVNQYADKTNLKIGVNPKKNICILRKNNYVRGREMNLEKLKIKLNEYVKH